MNGQEAKFFIEKNCSPTLDMLQYMHPAIVNMIAWTNHWCWDNAIKPVWTSWMRTPEENKALGATNTHVYRGADLSTKLEYGWTKNKCRVFENDFKRVFKRLGAYTYTDKGSLVRRPIIHHDIGHGPHFHFQCNPHAQVLHMGEMKVKHIKVPANESNE